MKNLVLIVLGLGIIAALGISMANKNTQNSSSTNSNTANSNTSSQASTSATSDDKMILFYGNGCPHCAKVEEFIKENKVKDKIALEEKEVYYNKNNSQELQEKAKACGIQADDIGVPLLWNKGKCLVGDRDIISFFQQEINK